MATNPMQRKARQSFLLGVIITLLLALIVIFILFNQMNKMKDKLNSQTAQKRQVNVLMQDVQSGQELTPDMFQMQEKLLWIFYCVLMLLKYTIRKISAQSIMILLSEVTIG